MSGNNIENIDLYKILDCSPDSSLYELKQAYHRKILESHPDKNQYLTNDTELFHQVKTAWEILGNPDTRKQYDTKCKQAELEAQSALIYARITISELETTEDENILSYQCRCGNSYLVHKTDLEIANCIVQVPCQDCTFVIVIET